MNIIWHFVYALTCMGQFYKHANGAQILALMPIVAKSHWNVMDSVLQTLVARGHNVTVLTPFLKKKPIANYTELDISDIEQPRIGVSWDTIIGECSVANNLPFLSQLHRHTCKTVFENDKLWRVIKSNK